MFNFDGTTKADIREDNPNWPEISDHPYRTFIVEGTGSGNKKRQTLIVFDDMIADMFSIKNLIQF